MITKTLIRSFAGGVQSPELFGRIDLTKNQTGLKTAINMLIRPHGPAVNRPGLEYVLDAKYGTKQSVVIPFQYNTEQTYILEFGEYYIRFHTNNATLLETAQSITAITNANPGVFTKVAHGYVVGDWLYFSGMVGMTELGGRFTKVAHATADTFDVEDMFGVGVNTAAYGVFTSGNVARVYEIASPYAEADLPSLVFTQSNDVLTLTHTSYATRELRRLGASSWSLSTVAFAPVQQAPTNVAAAASVGSGSVLYQYVVSALASEGLEESNASIHATSGVKTISAITNANPGVLTTSVAHGLLAGDPVYISGCVGLTALNGRYLTVNTVPLTTTLTLKDESGVVIDTTAMGTYTGSGSIYLDGIKNLLTTAGNKNTVTWTNASGGVRYNIYKAINGIWGYIGQSAGGSFVDDNITPDTTNTPPENYNPFPGSGDYPAAVGYYGGRRIFAGTVNKPQNLWATRSGTEKNMTYSIPGQADDAINARLTSGQANSVRHVVPLKDLLLLTSGAEWLVSASDGSGVITPSNIDYRPVDYIGAAVARPVVTNGAVLYAQSRGGRVREMKYTWQSNGYATKDISLLAPHLFDEYTLTSLTYTRAPYSALWAVRSDGGLLGLTYVPEEEVRAWHTHTTQGAFESVASVPEGTEDALYAVVRRTIDGQTKRYIERLHSRVAATIADCFFVDAGVTYSGTPATSIYVRHLEGATVSILADGYVLPQQVVTGGKVTLPVAASKVQVGLPYTADLETLPAAVEQAAAFGQGQIKNVNKAHVRIENSGTFAQGPSFNKLRDVKIPQDNPYGVPPTLYSGDVSATVDGVWRSDATMCLRQSDPLPLSVLYIATEWVLGG